MVWRSFDFGGHLVGIRSNSMEVGTWLRETFATQELRDWGADPILSIWVPPAAQATAGRRYLLLYREAVNVLRTFDPGELARRLIWEIDAWSLRRRDDAVYLNAGLVDKDGATALVPAGNVPRLKLGGRRERVLSFRNSPLLGVDSEGELFAVPAQADVPPEQLLALGTRLELPSKLPAPDDPVPPVVDAFCAFHDAPAHPATMPLTRAAAVFALAQYVLNIDRLGGRTLEPLAKLVERASCYVLQEGNSREAAGLLARVLDRNTNLLEAASA